MRSRPKTFKLPKSKMLKLSRSLSLSPNLKPMPTKTKRVRRLLLITKKTISQKLSQLLKLFKLNLKTLSHQSLLELTLLV